MPNNEEKGICFKPVAFSENLLFQALPRSSLTIFHPRSGDMLHDLAPSVIDSVPQGKFRGLSRAQCESQCCFGKMQDRAEGRSRCFFSDSSNLFFFFSQKTNFMPMSGYFKIKTLPRLILSIPNFSKTPPFKILGG